MTGQKVTRVVERYAIRRHLRMFRANTKLKGFVFAVQILFVNLFRLIKIRYTARRQAPMADDIGLE